MDTETCTAGAWLHNPVTGELARFDSSDPEGRRVAADLWLQPGAALARAHVHDHLVERFQVLEGHVAFRIGADERAVRAGSDPVTVPAGAVHDWWNAGDGVARVRVEITATPDAPGRAADRFVSMIEAMWSLGALGRVDDRGVPGPLWLAAIAREYRDTLRVARPPSAVQALVFGPLAAIARRTGRDPRAPELHGPRCACAVADAGDGELAALLATPVSRASAA